MRNRMPTRLLVLIAVLFATLVAASPLRAQSLDDLRASGAVGERWDGLVELRDTGNAGAKATVNQVNAERKKLYAKRASQEGATPEQVGQIFSAQILQGAPKGTWFLQQNGQWTQK